MATHSSVLAWRVPGTGEPGGLSSMGSHRVGHNWSDLAAAAAEIPSRKLKTPREILKEISPGCSLEGLMLKLKTPVLWPPDEKSWLIWKDPDPGKDWRWDEKGMTEDEMVGWHHRLDGHGFGWTPWVGDGQGGLTCCSSWGRKESIRLSDWTELNSTTQEGHRIR